MKNEKELPAEFRIALDEWAEDNLKAMGIFKDRFADFEALREKAIKQLRSVYSDKTIDMFLKPRNNRKIESPDCFGKQTGPDGHSMEIFIKIQDGLIADSSFQTNGCKAYIASGSMISEMIKGLDISKARTLNVKDIIKALDGLPKENEHCALLAINTLKEALDSLDTLKK